MTGINELCITKQVNVEQYKGYSIRKRRTLFESLLTYRLLITFDRNVENEIIESLELLPAILQPQGEIKDKYYFRS